MTMLDVRPTTARLLHGLPGTGAVDLTTHLATHGPLPVPSRPTAGWQDAVLHEVESSGLTGRGGAGFPAYRKMRMARRSGTRPVLLVNAMEGEPASGKDQCLLTFAPHLVLDGAELVAMAVGASTVVICVPAGTPSTDSRCSNRRWDSAYPCPTSGRTAKSRRCPVTI